MRVIKMNYKFMIILFFFTVKGKKTAQNHQIKWMVNLWGKLSISLYFWWFVHGYIVYNKHWSALCYIILNCNWLYCTILHAVLYCKRGPFIDFLLFIAQSLLQDFTICKNGWDVFTVHINSFVAWYIKINFFC